MYGHEAGCPYLTAAGGMGQCICGIESAYKAWAERRGVLTGNEPALTRQAFCAGWLARSGGQTFTSTMTINGASAVGPCLTVDGGIPLK